MKIAVAAAFALALAVPAFAQMKDMDHMKGMDMKSDRKAQPHKASGTVEKIDPAKGTVTIAHGPVQSMNWPGMTMAFRTKDPGLLDKVKVGDAVTFKAENANGQLTVTDLQVAR